MRNLIKKYEYLAAFVFFLGLLGIVFLPVIINKQTFFSAIPGLSLKNGPYDFTGLRTPWTLESGAYMWTEVPQTVFWYKELQKGHFAFWNPYQGGGQPLSASILSGIYNPLKLLLFGIFPYLKTFDFYILLRLLIAGFGAFIFLRKIRLSFQSALLGGVAYMFSGYFMNWLTSWSLNADMMTPYILLAIERLFESPYFKNILFLGLAIGLMILSGSPEAVIVVSLLTVFYFFFKFFFQEKRSFLFLISFSMALLIAFIISLPMLWDMALFFSQGLNAHSQIIDTKGSIESFSLRFNRTFQIFLSPSSFLEIARFGSLYKNNFVLPYIGVFVLLLSILGLSFNNDWRRNPYAVFFGAYILFFLLKLIGIPPIEWLSKLPFLNKVIFLKYNATLYFSLAILAAIGFENLKNYNINLKKFLNFSLFIALSLILLFLFSGNFRNLYKLSFAESSLAEINNQITKLPSAIADFVYYFINHPYFYTYLIIALNLILLLLFLIFWRKRWLPLIFIFLILELVLYIPKIRDGGFSPFNPFKEPPFVVFLKSRPDIDYYRIFALGNILAPQTASVYGLKDLRTNDPVYLNAYIDFMKPAIGDNYLEKIVSCWCVLLETEKIDKTLDQIFNFASVKYIISDQSLLSDFPYELIYDKEVKIYNNSQAIPIAYFKANNQISNIVKIVDYKPNYVVLEVEATSDGLLVLNDAFYPGWRVFVNGEEKDIVLIKEFFKGVNIGSGANKVVFKYMPLFTAKTLNSIISAVSF